MLKLFIFHPEEENLILKKDFYYSTERIRSRLDFKVYWTVEDGIKQIVTFYLERMEGEGL